MTEHLTERPFSIGGLDGIKLVVAAFGVLCGLTGIIAGIFEILQGNIATQGIIISTIGPNYLMYQDFTYYAITIIPNFLLTGILSLITSSLVITWSVRYAHSKNVALMILILSISQMLVGGGWVIDLGVITSILATRIDKPLSCARACVLFCSNNSISVLHETYYVVSLIIK